MAVVGEQERTRTGEPLDHFNRLVGLAEGFCKFGLGRSIGPVEHGHGDAGLLAKSEVDHRSVDNLLLHQQARADFDFTADAERIDTIRPGNFFFFPIASGRPNVLPVVIFFPLVNSANRLAGVREAKQIEPAVLGQIHGREDAFGKRAALLEQMSRLVSQPDTGAGRTSGDKVEAAVVVQVCCQEADGAGLLTRREVRPVGEIVNFPVFALLLVGDALEDAIAAAERPNQ